MEKPSITFRCPVALLDPANTLCKMTDLEFSELMLQALKLYMRRIRKQKRRIIPTYTDKDINFYIQNYCVIHNWLYDDFVSQDEDKLNI